MRAEGPPLPRGPLQLAPLRSALLTASHRAEPWLVAMAATLALAAGSELHPHRAESALEAGQQRGALPGPGSGTGTLVDTDPGAWPWAVRCQGSELVRQCLRHSESRGGTARLPRPSLGRSLPQPKPAHGALPGAYTRGLPWTQLHRGVFRPGPSAHRDVCLPARLWHLWPGFPGSALQRPPCVGVIWVLMGVASSGSSVE